MSENEERDTHTAHGEQEKEIAKAMLEQAEERTEASDANGADMGVAANDADLSFSREKVVWQKRKQLYSKQRSAEFTAADAKAWFSRLFRRERQGAR